ncbi:AGE family epimerase/isomerase (plasmid) [Ensifer adhaerens]|uniref:AGE family epimerase/isomerase n=1 Tax=Ensifer adhaerens TaxID=106592 RepID=UPI0023A9D0B8|nr:AGE family epimerase/isomerase [Ensifer adhaerens]WDZ80914.1 AGE family epimerase/isomerase [Ensifer adhaerens]
MQHNASDSTKFSLGTHTSIAGVQAHAREWLLTHAAPLWATAGVLSDGMFAERMKLDGKPASTMNRRMRVQARQIYCFSVIGSLGWEGPWQPVLEGAVSQFLQKAVGDNGYFVHLFNSGGEVISRAKDLYDHAFGLFALAHAARVLKRSELSDLSYDVFTRMMAEWWRPEGGFWEGELTPCPPFRQNPHMHMFEAAVVNYEVTGRREWEDLIQRLQHLFLVRFQEPSTGAVTEYFDQNWLRLPKGEGDIVEPGHCLEWAWLFEVGLPNGHGAAISDSLVNFARRFGVNEERGVAINEVYLDGSVRDGGARLWPQTERLKAAVARYQRLGSEGEASEIVRAYNGLCAYLNAPVAGIWHDRLNADGTWVEEDAPASSFYHIVCAFDQLFRIAA